MKLSDRVLANLTNSGVLDKTRAHLKTVSTVLPAADYDILLDEVYRRLLAAVAAAVDRVPAPFPTDKLEFWEQCVIAMLTAGAPAEQADNRATQLLLKRNNLIALLGEKNETL